MLRVKAAFIIKLLWIYYLRLISTVLLVFAKYFERNSVACEAPYRDTGRKVIWNMRNEISEFFDIKNRIILVHKYFNAFSTFPMLWSRNKSRHAFLVPFIYYVVFSEVVEERRGRYLILSPNVAYNLFTLIFSYQTF